MGSGVEFLLALEDWISVEVLLPFMSYHFSEDGGESWGYFELQKVRHSYIGRKCSVFSLFSPGMFLGD